MQTLCAAAFDDSYGPVVVFPQGKEFVISYSSSFLICFTEQFEILNYKNRRECKMGIGSRTENISEIVIL